MDADKLLEEQARDEVLTHLIEYGYLDGPAVGVARQVMAEGTRNLSSKQEYVYQKFVKEAYLDVHCKRCGVPLPTSEIIFALEETDGLCGWCAKMEEKNDRD